MFNFRSNLVERVCEKVCGGIKVKSLPVYNDNNILYSSLKPYATMSLESTAGWGTYENDLKIVIGRVLICRMFIDQDWTCLSITVYEKSWSNLNG
jgi:hypothetical protein